MNVARLEAASRSAGCWRAARTCACAARRSATRASASAAGARCRSCCSAVGMAEAFKNLINADTVREASHHLQRAWPAFDAARFEALALQGLDDLEFKARAMHLCAALEATLPADFDHAADVIEAALAPPGEGDDLSALRSGPQGLAGWVVWPLGEFVARRGIDAPQRALQALHALTQRHTAEWALRPFIERHPQIAFATLARWCARRQRACAPPGQRRQPPAPALGPAAEGPDPRPVADAAAAARAAGRPQRLRAAQRRQPPERHRQGPPAVDRRNGCERHLPDAPPQRRALLEACLPHADQAGPPAGAEGLGPGRAAARRGHAGAGAEAPGGGRGAAADGAAALRPRRARRRWSSTTRCTTSRPTASATPKVFKGWTLRARRRASTSR